MSPSHSNPPRIRGFTLIELLTVIAIIGVLAAIIIPTVGRVRETAKRAKCMSNARQIALSLISAANQDRKQMFPSNAGAGQWPWDVQHAVISDLVNKAGREVLYCPSSFMLSTNPIEQLFNYGGVPPNGYAVTNYVLLIDGTKQVNPIWLSKDLRSNYAFNMGGGVGAVELPPSLRYLVVDAIISNGATTFKPVTGGGLTTDTSNHMEGTKPMGGHTAYVDGHVKWRTFKTGAALPATWMDLFDQRSAGAVNFWF